MTPFSLWPLLLVSVLMYAVWRLWLRLRGEEFRPIGRRGFHTEAGHRYMKTLPPMTRKQRLQTLATVVVTLTLMGLFVVWVWPSPP